MFDKYDIKETWIHDNSTVKNYYNKIGPVSCSDLHSQSTTIRFDLDNQTLLTAPSDSCFDVRERLVKEADCTTYTVADAIT